MCYQQRCYIKFIIHLLSSGTASSEPETVVTGNCNLYLCR